MKGISFQRPTSKHFNQHLYHQTECPHRDRADRKGAQHVLCKPNTISAITGVATISCVQRPRDQRFVKHRLQLIPCGTAWCNRSKAEVNVNRGGADQIQLQL
jgi:hypothetical protein